MIRRREFITRLGGAAAWPLLARAQQGNRVRRIGVLMQLDENDPLMKAYLSAFTQALAGLGWADGRNVRMDLRWGRADINRIRALAQELLGLQPDIILTSGLVATAAVQRETRTIPIVFAGVGDPVASGIVPRLNQPGGNITGFASNEATLGGKWLELLSEIAPGLKRIAIMFNPDTPVSFFMPSLETAARSLKVEPITAPVHSDAEIETAIIALGREPGGGLVLIPDAFTIAHRVTIISAAARNTVPAVYALSAAARDGGLLSYDIDRVDTRRRAALAFRNRFRFLRAFDQIAVTFLGAAKAFWGAATIAFGSQPTSGAGLDLRQGREIPIDARQIDPHQFAAADTYQAHHLDFAETAQVALCAL
jgi:putative ABC transport system substrate-binding protein